MNVVDIKTELYSGVVLSMAEMPGEAIITMMATEGAAQMVRVLSMFKMAQTDQSERNLSLISGLPYGEMGEVLDQWSSKSAAEDVRQLDVVPTVEATGDSD